ncbi:MAG: malto-oligosyltrehalose trehalohydrolase [Thermoleophilia bacterium]|nr:malto-oligosyltrehalose trehalohydrolase [Thermoleophilia bacterium]
MRDDRLGATPRDDGSCEFRVWAPWAERVTVALADERREPLEPGEHGYHHGRVAGVAAGDRYAVLLDDDPLELPDPASASQPDGVHGWSQVVDHRAYAWGDDAWRGRPLEEYVIYELHVGTFTPEGTFDAVIGRLDELAEDGITAIELLPVAQFPGGRNWGYDGVDLYAAQSTYGGPEVLRRLVDAAHAHGIAIIVDVVYNHLGPEGNYLGKFGPYFTSQHHTPWGDAVNVDGPGSDEVRRFFIENALQWVCDFHADALRLDAIHGILDTSAHPFLAELTEAVEWEAARAERSVHVIAESDLNDVRVITPREAGGLGCHSQWTDDFHHALHVALTGELRGYYADFDDPVERLAESLRRGFVYTGQRSRHRDRRFGSDSSGLPGERFVVYAQNHDQVGNRLLGDRLAATLEPAAQRVALAAVLLSPFVPMLFMGEEYGEVRPFPYFTSHGDPQLVAAVRKGRREEFAHFGFEGEAPDPQGEETFCAAVLDWDARREGRHAELLSYTRELLRLRREHPSIRTMPELADVTVDGRVLTIERGAAGERTRLVIDFDAYDVTLEQIMPRSEVLLGAGVPA